MHVASLAAPRAPGNAASTPFAVRATALRASAVEDARRSVIDGVARNRGLTPDESRATRTPPSLATAPDGPTKRVSQTPETIRRVSDTIGARHQCPAPVRSNVSRDVWDDREP